MNRFQTLFNINLRRYIVGTAARVIAITKGDRPVRSYTLLLEGRCRFELNHFAAVTPFLVAHVRQIDSLGQTPRDVEADVELQSMATNFKVQARELVGAA